MSTSYEVTSLAKLSPGNSDPIDAFVSADGTLAIYSGIISSKGQTKDIRASRGATVTAMSADGMIYGQSNSGPYSFDTKTNTFSYIDLSAFAADATIKAANDRGDFAGEYRDPLDRTRRAYRYFNGVFEDLGAKNLYVYDMSNTGIVVGSQYVEDDPDTNARESTVAYVYDGAFRSLGHLPVDAPPPTSGDYRSGAYAVNDAGIVVGGGTRGYTDYGLREQNGVYSDPIDTGSSTTIVDVDAAGNLLASNYLGPVVIAVDGSQTQIRSSLGSEYSGWFLERSYGFDPNGNIIARAFKSGSSKQKFIVSISPVGTNPNTNPVETPDYPSDKVIANIRSTNMRDVVAAGDKVRVTIDLFNDTYRADDGRLSYSLYAVPAGNNDDDNTGRVQIFYVQGRLTTLGRGATVSQTFNFTLPKSLPGGSYTMRLEVSPSHFETPADNFIDDLSGPIFNVTDSFGTVADRRGVPLHRVDEVTGETATYTLSGPGTGSYEVDVDGNFNLTLNGTTLASKLSVKVTGGDRVTNVNNVVVNGAIGSINFANVTFAGGMTVQGGAKSILIGDVINPRVFTVGGATPTVFKFANVIGAELITTAPIRALTALSWNEGDVLTSLHRITAPSIGKLVSKGAFGADLIIAGTVKAVTIVGNVYETQWSAAGGFGAVTIKGDIAASTINAGHDRSAGTYIGASIKKLTVTGTASTLGVNAGYDGNSSTLLQGGQIKAITIKGGVDTDSRFAADLLPRRVKFGTLSIDPLADERFSTI